jgi:hypothetical protein
MQRVRIGLTGLAFVFLLVLLGAVFSNATHQEAGITANSLQHPAANAAANEAEPREPLAELGVAPGSADTNNASASPESQPAAPPAAAARRPR